MSLYDYQISQRIRDEDYPFYALIMAVMRKADTRNAAILKRAWPMIWDELQIRYASPGGRLAQEVGRVDIEEVAP